MQKIAEGDVITYTEYEIGALSGKKRIRLRLENMIVEAVIAPGEVLSKERIEQYFGEDLPSEACRALSTSAATRLMLKEDDGTMHCVGVSEAFLRSGYQTIKVGACAAPKQSADAPSYLQFMHAFGGMN